MISHQRLGIDAEGRGLGIAGLLRGDGEHLVVIHARRQVDAASHVPDLLQGLGVVDSLAVGALHHHGHGERITEIGMFLVDLDKGVGLGQQVGEYRLQLDVPQPPGEEGCDCYQHHQGQPDMVHDEFRNSITQGFQDSPRPLVVKNLSLLLLHVIASPSTVL